ncbi:MAG: deoxyhypusine synthase, partial [Candidatus Korarchaeota archaeon]|nr:deoxyhypusine synthase [Candidatus Korarchaeota archaeon]
QIELHRKITVDELVSEMQAAGVLGAGKVGKAADLITDMFSNPEYTVFLSIAGAMVPAGLRKLVADLVLNGSVDVIVSTGANVVHDLVEAIGFRHYLGSFTADDERLRREGFGRIGDIIISQKAFQRLEKWLGVVLKAIPEKKREKIASYELLDEIGKRIEDPNSILAAATKRKVPVICPGIVDSIVGFQMWIFSQDLKLGLDPLLDTQKITELVFDSERKGAIILGGGWPKHYTLFANSFRNGVDCAVQITMDRPEPGGLSGASLEEAISWSKVKSEGRNVTVVSDATIVFPLIIAAVIDRI